MSISSGHNQRFLPVLLGAVTLAGVAVLLGWDAFPRLFPAGSHATLAAFSLAMIALAYLAYQIALRPAAMEFLKAIMLAIAFLFWAANQFWPSTPHATLFNDIAIALFVFDVFLVIVGWPRTSQGTLFAESRPGRCAECCTCACGEEQRYAGPVSTG
ncbi:MAG: hypothetical protein ABSE36_20835 [Terracidiphilus sp.]|jgi:hypothetical protein